MSVTGFLSLWISNTASASMMLPIVVALAKQIAKYNPLFSKSLKNKSQNNLQSNKYIFGIIY